MSIIYITIGFTGSGKSTWARNFAQQHPNTKIVSPDCFREMLNGEYKYLVELDDVITQSCFDTAKNLLEGGYDVIIDCGNLTRSADRRAKWKQLPAHRFVAVMMPMDKAVDWYVNRRLCKPHWGIDVRKIVENEMKTYEPPDTMEFEEVIFVKENE